MLDLFAPGCNREGKTSCFKSPRRRELEHHVRGMRILLLSMVVIAPGAVLAQQPPNTAAPAAQQVPDPKAKITACLSEDAPFLADHVIGCYEQELRRQDALLNGAYQRLVKKFPSIKAKLIDGQRAWIAYRDNWCGYEGLIDQPPSAAASKAICMSELTEAQAHRLKELGDADAEALTEAPSNVVPPRAPVASNSASSAVPASPASSTRESKSSADLSELCKDYSEDDRQRALMIDLNRIGKPRLTPEQRARFEQQHSVCPDWQKKQAQEAEKNGKAILRSIIDQLSECSSQKIQMDAAFNRALEIPAFKTEIEGALMLLAVGQPKMYCEKIQNAVRPYLDIRDILARCGSARSLDQSMTLNLTFGGIDQEARQNGCRN